MNVLRWVWLGAGCGLLMAAKPISGPTLPPLTVFEGRTIVTGTDLRSRPAGLRTCLMDVLVKTSGDPALLADRRAVALDPADAVQSISYVDRMSGLSHHDEQGSSDRPFYLTARFDGTRIETMLTRLGVQPWIDPRPPIVPDISVQGPPGTFRITPGEPRAADMRAALEDAADRYAMPLRWTAVAGGPAPFALAGTLTWSEAAHGWVADWRTTAKGRLHRWQASGVSFDEAFRVGVRGVMGVAAGHGPQ